MREGWFACGELSAERHDQRAEGEIWVGNVSDQDKFDSKREAEVKQDFHSKALSAGLVFKKYVKRAVWVQAADSAIC